MPILRRLMTITVALIVGGCQAAPAGTIAPDSPSAAASTVVTPSMPAAALAAASAVALPTAPPVSLLVDTDGAPDDLVALSFLVAAPNVTLEAITVSGTGEVHCPGGVDIVLRLLERLGAPEIPVACGTDRPIALGHTFPDLFRSNADAAAGLDLPPTTRSAAKTTAVELIGSTVGDGGGHLRTLTLGPLTNLAQALTERPELAKSIESIYVMGGAFDVPGNIAGSPGGPQDNTAAEWNVYVDPAALAKVLTAGTDVRLVSLDGTNQVPVTPAFAEQVRSTASGAPLAVLAELFQKNDYMTSGRFYLWDTVAAIAAAGYPVADFTDAELTVDVTESVTSGATRRGDGLPNASYMTRADAATIEALLLDVMNRS
jgi:pyrimidine-specific ribonucleoside hydrolase